MWALVGNLIQSNQKQSMQLLSSHLNLNIFVKIPVLGFPPRTVAQYICSCSYLSFLTAALACGPCALLPKIMPQRKRPLTEEEDLACKHRRGEQVCRQPTREIKVQHNDCLWSETDGLYIVCSKYFPCVPLLPPQWCPKRFEHLSKQSFFVLSLNSQFESVFGVKLRTHGKSEREHFFQQGNHILLTRTKLG